MAGLESRGQRGMGAPDRTSSSPMVRRPTRGASDNSPEIPVRCLHLEHDTHLERG